MGSDVVSLEVGADVVRPIIEKRIAAAIAEELGGAEAMIEKMVASALSVKVNRDGFVSKYSSDNKCDFVEAVTGKTIRGAAQEAMKQWAKDNSQKIKDAIIKEMMKPTSCRKLAKAFAEAATNSIAISWKPTINVEFSPRSDRY